MVVNHEDVAETDSEVRQAGALLMLLMEEREELKVRGHLHHSDLSYADRYCPGSSPAAILCPGPQSLGSTFPSS